MGVFAFFPQRLLSVPAFIEALRLSTDANTVSIKSTFMSSQSKKSSKITEFFSPKANLDKMEGTKSKKRTIENDARSKMSPKKAKAEKKHKDDSGKKKKATSEKRYRCKEIVFCLHLFYQEFSRRTEGQSSERWHTSAQSERSGEADWREMEEIVGYRKKTFR